MVTIAVMLAAGVGAVVRYLLDQAVQRRTTGAFPAGTFAVNVSGSLLLGFVIGLAIHHGLAATPTAVIGAGFAGGYTTFSTWMWETVALAESGAAAEAVANIAGSLSVGLAAAAAGLGLALL